MNIVVAVLLDEFISTMSQEKAQEAEEHKTHRREKLAGGVLTLTGPLDPMLKHLCKFTTHDELMQMIDDLFGRIGFHSNGAVNFEETSLSLHKNKVHIDEDDWQAMTAGLLDDHNNLDGVAFSVIIRRQLKTYTQRQIVNAMGPPIIEDTQARQFTKHICV